MKTWKLLIEYDGSKYRGWQDQANARTVAGELKRAAESALKTAVELQGAGRTDAGVHALGQVAHLRIRTSTSKPPARLMAELNDDLPAEIAILRCEEASPRFHARHDAISRTYRYNITRSKSAFTKKHAWWIKEPLDLDRMENAVQRLKGKHNFACFRAEDPSKPRESPLVEITHASLEPDGNRIVFRIEAGHFLWRMVRRIVGVLVKIGKGDVTDAEFIKLLAGKCDPRLDVAAWTAPAAGLFLESVKYEI